MVSRLIYLDSSAIVRLVLQEPGWEALMRYLREQPHRVTSALSGTEVRRAVHRARASADRSARADAVLDRLDQVAISADVLARAAGVEPWSLRTLDAVHLATALELRPLAGFVTYDTRLAEGARVNGLPVQAPA